MQPNRVSQWFEEETTRNVAPAVSALPCLAGFAVCPVMLFQMPWQAQLYQAAYDQARAAVAAVTARPLFKPCWN
jgi:hypothetical protein